MGSRFRASNTSFWWGVEEIKELRYIVGLLACLLDISLILWFGYSFFVATLIGFVFDITVYGLISVVSTLAERRYRNYQRVRSRLAITLNKLSLNSKRRSYLGKDHFDGY